MSNNAIRLTNKTAILLRKSAVKSRNIHYACTVVLSVLMCVLAFFLGLKWLWAVPVTVGVTVILDMLIVFHGRKSYLSLIGQAICTEAAARDIRAGMSESQRREKAITDLIGVKADAQRAAQENRQRKKADRKKAEPAEKPVYEAAQYARTADQEMTARISIQNDPAPRRRRREDGLKLIRGEQSR